MASGRSLMVDIGSASFSDCSSMGMWQALNKVRITADRKVNKTFIKITQLGIDQSYKIGKRKSTELCESQSKLRSIDAMRMDV